MFCSRDEVYKNPTGAVKAGENIHFKISLPRDFSCSASSLIMEREGGETRVHEMFWCGMNGEHEEWWECDFAPQSVPSAGRTRPCAPQCRRREGGSFPRGVPGRLRPASLCSAPRGLPPLLRRRAGGRGNLSDFPGQIPLFRHCKGRRTVLQEAPRELG